SPPPKASTARRAITPIAPIISFVWVNAPTTEASTMAYTRPRSRGEVALSQHRRIRKIGGLARGCEPEGTADELCKRKEADAAKPEPPGEIIAEALKFLRADRTGRWHVRAP